MENLSASSSRIGEKRLPIVGKYRLLAEIGHGGMAEVFLAVMEGPAKFSKLIALKMLRSQFAEDPEGREMFLNEARLAARLNHPNVVQTYEVGELDNRYFIAMEYLDGQPYSRVLSRSRSGDHPTIPLAMSLRIIADALSGLDYAHDLKDFDGTPLNLVHRDVSPHNVFVTYDGQVKVLDFGIAKAAGSSAETRTGVLKGKVGYMAPEQISDLPLDRRVDVYAAGVMIWEAVAGRKVWKGLSDVATLSKVASEGVPSLKTVVPDVDPELEKIVAKATARVRDERYDSASELQAALEGYIETMKDGGKATPRGIAKWVSDTFKDMRDETKRLIESQLTKAKSIPPGGGVAPAAFPSTMSMIASNPSLTPSNSNKSISQSATGQITVSAVEPAPAKGRGPLVVVALLGAAAIAGASWVALRNRVDASAQTSPPTPTVAPTPQPPPPVATPSAAAQVAPILVKVDAQPREAKVYLDGVALAGNPVEHSVAKDGKTHALKVEADGYVVKEESFTADSDKSFTVVLEKSAAKPGTPPAKTNGGGSKPKSDPAPTSSAAPPPPPPPTVTAAPPPPPPTATATSNKKKIDEDNPFK